MLKYALLLNIANPNVEYFTKMGKICTVYIKNFAIQNLLYCYFITLVTILHV